MLRLETSDLSKTYRGRRVVDDVTVSLQQGEVVGLLGPNGAGKTT
ncbi:MAG TPA: ATP-binding cassette domain-containing protein, partial [Bryobacteraceae bacterium]|nr:ATP-binding cassette domain-containing protein [Bryobacteraceae bacterium]